MTRASFTAMSALTFALVALPLTAPATSAIPTDESTKTLIGTVFGTRTTALREYTFDVNVDVKMQTFPWMRFSMGGKGHYSRGGTYDVHFDRVPWFAHDFQSVSLSPIEPLCWPQEFLVSVRDRKTDALELDLHERVPSRVVEARATVDPRTPVLKRLFVRYEDGGKIELAFRPTEAAGFAFPGVADIAIAMPKGRASAVATFNNYQVSTETN